MTDSVLSMLHNKQPVVMGILNTTPDSFSDGGQFVSVDKAVCHAMDMVKDGASIIDVGGESTRPGAQSVSIEDEINRVVPVIEAIRQRSEICISIDTSKTDVMQAAIRAGARFVNDVNGLRAKGAVEVCAEQGALVCVMHMQGQPRSMQESPVYENVVKDVAAFLKQRIEACRAAGIRPEKIIIDPGFGFGKTRQHNMQLLQQLDELKVLGVPVLLGLSRKSVLGAILDAPPEQRLYGSVAAAVLGWTKGAQIFRVHDIKPTVDALKVCMAMVCEGVESLSR
ncbi:Dihydropteroate synthase [hydrothermal vent metagenome]|uniref:dihydropteroate synthase n=1 Tax=hydrothermal vent metagenome TaxID=652676 RepID=A0A3B0Y546_9ZZZZ